MIFSFIFKKTKTQTRSHLKHLLNMQTRNREREMDVMRHHTTAPAQRKKEKCYNKNNGHSTCSNWEINLIIISSRITYVCTLFLLFIITFTGITILPQTHALVRCTIPKLILKIIIQKYMTIFKHIHICINIYVYIF